MIKVKNLSDGKLVFPCGVVLAGGQKGSVYDDDVRHPVVAGWIKEGMIEAEKHVPKEIKQPVKNKKEEL